MSLAFLGVVYVGIIQNGINQNLLDLNFIPSVYVHWDNPPNGQIDISNTGDKDIFVGAIIFDDPLASSTKLGGDYSQTRVVPPGNYYYFPSDTDEQNAITEHFRLLGQNGEVNIPVDIRLKSINGTKYIAKCLIHLRSQNRVQSIDTQTASILKENWSDNSIKD